MLSLFNPWVILGVVLALLGSFGSGYYSGEQNEYERQQIEIAALNAKARETEQRMGEVAQTYAQTLRKANNVAKAKETKLRSDIASGERKLFIPVKAPECAVPATADSTTPSGDSRETRTELDRSVAEALIAITADGDQAIRKLNACIDQYEKMRSFK
jgi:hypothetical protein